MMANSETKTHNDMCHKVVIFLIFVDPRQKQKLYKVDHTRAGDQQVLVDCEMYFYWEHGLLLWKLLLLVHMTS